MLERLDTKERILDAAEKLFSDTGLAKTSLRAITHEAGVNVAAIHYHFGSKHGLLHELLARRVAPLNRERLERLDEIERAAGDGPLALRDVLEAFVVPVVRLVEEAAFDRRSLSQLIGRLYAEPDELEPILREHFGEVAERFTQALRRTLPNASPSDVAWRLHFAVGVLAHVLLARHEYGIIPGLDAREGGGQPLAERLVTFLVGGFREGDA